MSLAPEGSVLPATMVSVRVACAVVDVCQAAAEVAELPLMVQAVRLAVP